MAQKQTGRPLGLYIHIPFCRSKCEYCDFYSIAGGRDRDMMERYTDAVIAHLREAAARAGQYSVDTIYFGGGTPSFFGAARLKPILTEIFRRFDVARGAEITLEANPDSVTPHELRKLQRAGFNRISIGVQSDSNELLKALGRPHSYQQAVTAVREARAAGFDNVSIDLMYGLPNQTREQWMHTLEHALALKPDHISCYGLKVEPGTPLDSYRDCANLPDDDTQADMYLCAVDYLESYGYSQYEISNFAASGRESRHNLKYWLGGEYLGFGRRIGLRRQALHVRARPRGLHHRRDGRRRRALRVRGHAPARARGRIPHAAPAHALRHRPGRIYAPVPDAVRSARDRSGRIRENGLRPQKRQRLAPDAERLPRLEPDHRRAFGRAGGVRPAERAPRVRKSSALRRKYGFSQKIRLTRRGRIRYNNLACLDRFTLLHAAAAAWRLLSIIF